MEMTDHGIAARFASDVTSPAQLVLRIRAAIATTPAPSVSTRVRIAAALPAAPCTAAAVLVVANRLVSDRPVVRQALRIDQGVAWSSAFLLVVLHAASERKLHDPLIR
jgi:hypothetical protein